MGQYNLNLGAVWGGVFGGGGGGNQGFLGKK